MITEKIKGNDCIYPKYLQNPKKLCDIIAEKLAYLHQIEPKNCPIPNHTENYLQLAYYNYKNGTYNKSQFPNNFGYKNEQDALNVICKNKHLLKCDTLLHGDYCLPNIILDNWKFKGFIDLDCAGVGDRHIDLFWGAWTLNFNIGTDQYRDRFFDAYGRDRIDVDRLKLVGCCEVFG